MKIYAINLTVDTKTTDLYDKVAVNKYPVIAFCNSEIELWKRLASPETANWIRSNIRTKHLFDTAFFHIREIKPDGSTTKDLCWQVNSMIDMDEEVQTIHTKDHSKNA